MTDLGVDGSMKQVECEEYLPEAVREAEHVMSTVNTLYSGFQPLLFPDTAKPGMSFYFCVCDLLLLNGAL